MGFLDNVLKAVNKAVDFVENIQDKANEAYATKPANEAVPATPTALDTVTISMPAQTNCRVCKTTFFDCDDNENDAKIEVSMSIDKRFHEFDSGAGEIDASYVYSPEITDDDQYAAWDTGTPYIMFGYEQQHYNILKAYKDGKALPSGTTLSKVSGCERISYKSTMTRGNNYYVAYHFNRGFCKDLLYHFEACYPVSYKGQPIEKIILDALDLMATTYTETIQ